MSFAKILVITSALLAGVTSASAMQDTVRNTRASADLSSVRSVQMRTNNSGFQGGYRVQPYSAQERLLADRLSGGININ